MDPLSTASDMAVSHSTLTVLLLWWVTRFPNARLKTDPTSTRVSKIQNQPRSSVISMIQTPWRTNKTFRSSDLLHHNPTDSFSPGARELRVTRGFPEVFPLFCGLSTPFKLLHSCNNICWEWAAVGKLQDSSQGKDRSDGQIRTGTGCLFFLAALSLCLPRDLSRLVVHSVDDIEHKVWNKWWIDYRHTLCCVGKKFWSDYKCFLEDCFVAWFCSHCKNKDHLCETMLHTVWHDSFLLLGSWLHC